MTNTIPDYKRRALEQRRAQLIEEFEVANAQLGRTLSEVDRLRIQRQIAALEAKIEEVAAGLRESIVAEKPGLPWLDTLTQPDDASSTTRLSGPDATNSPRSLSVFLSYASEDKPKVREINRRLQSAGIDSWLDEERLLPGQDWPLEIRKAMRSVDALLVCLSSKSVSKAGYVQKELKFALDIADEQPEGAIFLIPVKLDACDVPERLSNLQWVHLYEPNGWERLTRALNKRAEDIGITG